MKPMKISQVSAILTKDAPAGAFAKEKKIAGAGNSIIMT